MNLAQAKTELVKYSKLIGQYDGDDEITHIVINPIGKNLLGDILTSVWMEEDYNHLLLGSIEFELIVLFNYNDPNQGLYTHLPLTTVISRLGL